MTVVNEREAQVQWHAAFIAVQDELPEIKKTKTATIPTKKGGSFSYSYADLSVIIDAVRPILTKHGLAAVQDVSGDGSVSVATRIYHKGGHVETFGPLVFPAGEDTRSAGSAITYARRYALGAALGIAPDEDTDGPPPPNPDEPWYHPYFYELRDYLLTATNEVRAEKNLPAVPDLVNARRPSKTNLAKILKRARELKSARSDSTTTSTGPESEPQPGGTSSSGSSQGDGSW